MVYFMKRLRRLFSLTMVLALILSSTLLTSCNSNNAIDNDLTEQTPSFGISYDLEYKEKLFPNMTDLEIQDILGRIIAVAGKTFQGEKFEVTEEELEILGIKGLDPKYFDKILISTE